MYILSTVIKNLTTVMQNFNSQRARDCRGIEKEEGCEIYKMHVKLKILIGRFQLEILDLDTAITIQVRKCLQGLPFLVRLNRFLSVS
jgi:hypothetical protein